jgi:hypothetical protein
VLADADLLATMTNGAKAMAKPVAQMMRCLADLAPIVAPLPSLMRRPKGWGSRSQATPDPRAQSFRDVSDELPSTP